MKEKKISKEILIEDLIREVSDSVSYLMKEGIRCLVCGEPAWGTLETATKEKGFNDKQIEKFISEINKLYQKEMNN